MCEKFECTHQRDGFCIYDDQECEGKSCGMWGECGSCENITYECMEEK